METDYRVTADLTPGWEARLYGRQAARRSRNLNRMLIKTHLLSPHGNWLDEVNFQMGRLLGVYRRPTATDRLLRRE